MGLPLERASMALDRQMLRTSSGAAGHLSGSDRAARCPTGKGTRCWHWQIGRPGAGLSTDLYCTARQPTCCRGIARRSLTS